MAWHDWLKRVTNAIRYQKVVLFSQLIGSVHDICICILSQQRNPLPWNSVVSVHFDCPIIFRTDWHQCQGYHLTGPHRGEQGLISHKASRESGKVDLGRERWGDCALNLLENIFFIQRVLSPVLLWHWI